MSFAGFSAETLAFLSGLSAHNDKAWFDAHRADYEAHWVEAGKSFIGALEPKLKKLAPDVRCEPKINGSLFRINRDTRFSPDKRPYKDHLDLWFWEGPARKAAATGFFFRLKAEYVAVGVGAHGFDPAKLKIFRDLVVDKAAGPALIAAVKKVEKAGYEVKGEHYKKLPKGYDLPPGGALGDRLLRHNALWVGAEEPISAVVRSAALVDHCLAHWKKMAPVHRWLVEYLQ